ncbi:MAG: nucleotidyltransferase domain-containing protein [Promethearchaeota archaeon]
MSKERILREHYNEVKYSKQQWDLLKEKRESAINLLKMFENEGLRAYVYGSIARGNVHKNSDIDVIFLQQITPFRVELILNKNNIFNYEREIIMATPKDAIKLYIYLSELESITIPITKLNKTNLEFYDFGGKIDLKQLKINLRVPGVDKRLVFIKPTKKGHIEYSLIGNESIVAKEIGIDIKTILEREKVLLKREKYGRTGVYLKKKIAPEESFEKVLKELIKSKSIVREKMLKR